MSTATSTCTINKWTWTCEVPIKDVCRCCNKSKVVSCCLAALSISTSVCADENWLSISLVPGTRETTVCADENWLSISLVPGTRETTDPFNIHHEYCEIASHLTFQWSLVRSVIAAYCLNLMSSEKWLLPSFACSVLWWGTTSGLTNLCYATQWHQASSGVVSKVYQTHMPFTIQIPSVRLHFHHRLEYCKIFAKQ